MLIILEGGDGTGKSSLVQRLVDYVHRILPGDEVTVLRRGPLRNDPVREYEDDLLSYRPGLGRHIICDRWHLGEYVYPPIIHNRESRLDPARWLHIELLLQSRGAYTVWCQATPERVTETLCERGDDLVSPEHVERIHASYVGAFSRTRLTYAPYSYATHGGPGDLFVANVVQHARRAEATAVPLRDFVTYVGPPNVDVLLLGAVRHGLRHRPIYALRVSPEAHRDLGPAFVPTSATSGHFLLTHLDRVLQTDPNGSATRIGLANACDADDPSAIWRALGRPNVVALGRDACRELCATQLPHGSVPHPQYVRRFFAAHGGAYLATVGDAVRDCRHLLSWRPVGTWYDSTRRDGEK